MAHAKRKGRGIAFKHTLNAKSILNPSVAISADDFTVIGTLEVEARTQRGFGFASDGSDLLGTVYMKIMDNQATAVKIEGTVRLVHSDPHGAERVVVWEGRTEDLDQGLNDRRLRVKLEGAHPPVNEDGKLVIEMKADTAATMDRADCVALIDSYKVLK